MGSRVYTREYKLEAVRRVTERGVSNFGDSAFY
jgi:hypothetical protein